MKLSTLFKPIKDISMSQYVLNEIKKAVLSGKLAAGSQLVESQLAKMFNVSQITVREALLQLEQTGLVTRMAHKGTRVIKLTDEEVAERLNIRFQLEELACVEAARNMSDKQIKILETKLEEMNKAIAQNQYYELTRADLSFHRHIWTCTSNTVLYQTLDQLTTPLFAYLMIQHSSQGHDIRSYLYPHDEYVKAIKSQDEDYILQVVRADATNSYEGYLGDRNNK
jgi:DNA-binding GntR family transcriptional regulator